MKVAKSDIIGSMEEIKRTCTKCGKEFWVIKQEQQFLNKMGLPLPTMCPADRQARRLKHRGERNLYKSKCQNCGKDIIVTYDPKSVESNQKMLCKKCYLEWFEKNSALIS